MAVELLQYGILDSFLEQDDDDDYDFQTDIIALFAALSNLRRDVVPKVTLFVEDVVPCFTESDFRKHFRLSIATFSNLLEEIGPALEVIPRLEGKPPINPKKQVMICLWYMVNKDSMREVSTLFGVSKSTVYKCVHKVTDALCAIQDRVIQWPSSERQRIIATTFEDACEIPNIVGAIDGTHIRLGGVPDKDQDYINRKGYPSVQLQVVVDEMMCFTDIYVGWPGATHDARVFRNSPFFDAAENGNLFNDDCFIIGDSAYPLKEYLMTPFRDNGHLTPLQRTYNRKISSARQIVERSIGLLKCRFRTLQNLACLHIERVCKIITACCVLHNLCILSEDTMMDLLTGYEHEEDVNRYPFIYADNAAGEAKRRRIMNNI